MAGAQLLAAIGTATMPVLLGAAHVANTTAYELLAWAGLALVVARIGRTGDCRWWLAGGLVAGVGVADDHSMGFFAIALVIGALLSGGRRVIFNRWFAAGAAIAVAFEIPDLWWQAQHQWATIAMTHALNQENGGLGNIATFIIGQLGLVTLALAWVWVVGLRFLWRSGRPLWRALAWAYGLLFVLFALTAGAKTYYLAATYVYLLAAGAVAIDGWLQARPGRLPNSHAGHRADDRGGPADRPAGAPARRHRLDLQDEPDPGRDHRLAPARPHRRHGMVLPATQSACQRRDLQRRLRRGRRHQRARPGTGLPTAVSGHNSLWWWGPGNPRATTVVAVAPGPVDVTGYAAYLSQFFTSVRVAATLLNPYGLHNQEWGGHVYVCTGPVSHGPGCGHGCATMTDSRAQQPANRVRAVPTAGCVTLPVGELLEILRWLNPAASPRIAMGVGTLGW